MSIIRLEHVYWLSKNQRVGQIAIPHIEDAMPQNSQGLDSALLAQVQHTIARSLIAAEAREQALGLMLQQNADRHLADSLQACQKRVQSLEGLTVSIAGKLTGVDMLLAKEEDYLRAHLTAAADLRRRLEEWSARAIG
jgi:hypothetical protein